MSDLKTAALESDGEKYTLTMREAGGEGKSLEAILRNEAGDETGRITYVITKELLGAWKLDSESAMKFLARFAKSYTRTRMAAGAMVGKDEYIFDTDFAAMRPEAILEKIESECARIA